MRAALALVVLGAAGVLAGCGGGIADDAEPVRGVTEVSVVDNDFEPQVIEVPAGTTVTWRFEGGTQHNVSGEGFRSDTMKDGEFQHTFDAPGQYDYLCTLHAGMEGRVLVVE
jgi:plastocyanin